MKQVLGILKNYLKVAFVATLIPSALAMASEPPVEDNSVMNSQVMEQKACEAFATISPRK